ncbi:FAD-dependent oxidoreductase [Mesobacillus foraminis]|uniref:FAD-dependent oxidoreductase n=1 Tax=Mesobacillus foraminis TaxID=279826 RepID=UPI001BE5CF1D|nr:FAD-dependent oxidoreductase [Mesobacillus foraminis]MBT2758051.1 FAD-dependent oxidoreductase [Mesobacillus foraminis]
MKFDLLIAGGGLGGCAASLAACSKGLRVVMTEETDWIGGQVTSQGVPPDENRWIEEFGCTGRYREYRNRVRDYYLRNMPVTESTQYLNPGKGLVGSLCHDPRVTLAVLYEMLSPYLLSGQLTLWNNTIVSSIEREGAILKKAVVLNTVTSKKTAIDFNYIIDATEAGDLLPLAKMEYVIGAESKADTDEPHATEEPEPHNIQAFTHVLAMEYREGENHVIPKPELYDFWKEFQPAFWPDKLLSLNAPHPITHEKREYVMFPHEDKFPLWEYRRIFAADSFRLNGAGDISLMNWPQNDYFLGNVYDVTPEEKEEHLFKAKQLSLSLFYWLQTEAPRPGGGKGYPGLKLRGDVLGTPDGLAKSVYIRESRRIKAHYTIREQDVSPSFQKGKTGKSYFDSVGIGSYSIDLHPSISGQNYIDIPALPFQIPLGALLPKETDNLLAGNKNIGTTHITNGCYRLHPVEWNIGEACGALVAYCVKNQIKPLEVRETSSELESFQASLRADGFELEWPEDRIGG